MQIILLPKAQEHLNLWEKSGNKVILKRIALLIRAITDNPFSGMGKPEPLKYQLAGKWSRRIDKKNRLVYSVVNDTIYVYSLKGHYL